MSKETLSNKDASITYMPLFSAVVSTGKVEKPAYPTSPIEKPSGSGKISPWGDDNQFPQNVVKAAEKTFIPSVISWKVRAMGTRLVYGIEDVDAAGNVKFIRQKDKVVEEWLRRNNTSRYLRESASDLYWFGNFFPEMVLSNDRSQIASLVAQESTYCRFEKQNPSTGLSDNVYINANWDNGGKEEDSQIVKTLDPYYDPVGSLQARTDAFKYIYPCSFPSPGKTYYQLVPWDSVRKNGWLDIAALIPTWKKALMKNQISIKFHIKIPKWYWSWKYPKWEEMSFDEQTNARKTEITEFNDFLQGEEKAGKSIMTTSMFDASSGQYSGWEITPLDDKLADGKYIEDSQEASSQMLFALEVDGTLIGSLPGKGLGAGSGSDKRVAFNIYMAMQQPNEELILEPLHFIRDYNGWNPEYKFKLLHDTITTLDKGKETQPTA